MIPALAQFSPQAMLAALMVALIALRLVWCVWNDFTVPAWAAWLAVAVAFGLGCLGWQALTTNPHFYPL